MPEGNTLTPYVQDLPKALSSPFCWLVYLGILSTTVANILPTSLGIVLIFCFLVLDLSGLSRLLRDTSVGFLVLFMAIYILRPSVLVLVLFTVYFQAIFYWNGRQPIHYLWIIAMGFVHLAVISTIMSSVAYLFFFTTFVILITRGLLVTDFLRGITHDENRIDLQELKKYGGHVTNRMRVTSYWIAGFSILIAGFFFPFLPRVEGLAYQPSQFAEESVSGFSDEVTLGDMGAIQADNRVALRVFMPKDLYRRISRWRGAVLERWDSFAQRWSSDTSRLDLDADEKIIHLPAPPDHSSIRDRRKDHGAEIAVSITAMEDPRIFLPELDGRMPWMTAFIRGDFFRIGFDPDSWTIQPRDNLRYRGFDYEITLWNDELAAEKRPLPSDVLPETLRKCVSLATLSESFLRNLEERAESLVAGYQQRSVDPLELAQALSVGLQSTQAYTLDFTQPNSARSLEQFITEQKAGNCEYFATTLALFLRAYGIPARLVTGFVAGRENQIGNYLMIRQSDAHSWVEAYFEDQGWMTFDPTPLTRSELGFLLDHFGFMVDLYDFFQLQWNTYILDYSQGDQKSLLSMIFASALFQPRSILHLGWWLYMARPMIALVLFVVFLLWLIRELLPDIGFHHWSLNLPSMRWFHWKKRGAHIATRFFHKVERVWTRRGFTRPVGETPRAYLQRIRQAYPEYGDSCAEFLELYNNGRYGIVADETQWIREIRHQSTQLLTTRSVPRRNDPVSTTIPPVVISK